MMAICKSALSEGNGQVTLLYANRDEKSVIFAAALRELAAKYPDRFVGRALAGVGAGAAERGGAGPAGGAVHRPRGVHLRARPVHGGRPGRAGNPRRARQAGAHRGVPVAGHRPVRRGRDRRGGRRRRAAGHRGRHARRRDPRGQLAAQRQAARRAARQGPRRAVLLPRGPLRRVRGAAEERRGRDGGQRRPRAIRSRRGSDPGLPGQAR